jgi:hypothetical protein
MTTHQKAQRKISRALAVLNGFSPQPEKRYRTVTAKMDTTCPVCHDPACTREWTDEAHAKELTV